MVSNQEHETDRLDSVVNQSFVLDRRVVATYQYFLSCRKLETNILAGGVIHTCFHNLQGFPPIITSIDYTHYVTLSPCVVSPNACAKCFLQPIKTTLNGSALSTSPPLQADSHNTELAPTTSKLISYRQHYWSVHLYHACSLVVHETFYDFHLGISRGDGSGLRGSWFCCSE